MLNTLFTAQITYTLASVLVVSAISLIGIITLGLAIDKLKMLVKYLVAFSAGALLGDVFFHLFPEIAEDTGITAQTGLFVLLGIGMLYVLEKFIHWQHCHHVGEKNHVHSFAWINVVGDVVHNFIDGITVAVSYLVSIPVGIATTTAIVLHEIPHEMGNFGIFIHAGFSRGKALLINFLTALAAIVGAIATIILAEFFTSITKILIPIAIGNFIYIACSDLIPETHKHTSTKESVLLVLAIVIGAAVMALMLLME